jgi:hypothetical protein
MEKEKKHNVIKLLHSIKPRANQAERKADIPKRKKKSGGAMPVAGYTVRE